MLAAMAQATERLRIGVQVSGMPYRHPAVLANMAATIDVIADGRLDIGLGAGWNDEEAAAYGIELPPLGERFDRFDEGVEAIVLLLTQETTTLDGNWVQLTDARCEPKSVQQPHAPIVIGGNGRTRTLRTTARWAQQWNSLSGSPQEWRELRDVLDGHCADCGRDPKEIESSITLWYDPERGPAALVDEADAFGEAGVDLTVIYLPIPHTPDVLEPLAEAIRAR
jgi:alkanesulfonate monooxygenase SsuD/methylene tetrahydromethanopterin reductase-like flavin-dependent oxidoreductase (luciferase family)